MGSAGWIIVGAACIISSLIMWIQGRDNECRDKDKSRRRKNLSA